jgi:hypothetical protein
LSGKVIYRERYSIEYGIDDSGIECIPQPNRIAEDMQIVEIVLLDMTEYKEEIHAFRNILAGE